MQRTTATRPGLLESLLTAVVAMFGLVAVDRMGISGWWAALLGAGVAVCLKSLHVLAAATRKSKSPAEPLPLTAQGARIQARPKWPARRHAPATMMRLRAERESPTGDHIFLGSQFRATPPERNKAKSWLPISVVAILGALSISLFAAVRWGTQKPAYNAPTRKVPEAKPAAAVSPSSKSMRDGGVGFKSIKAIAVWRFDAGAPIVSPPPMGDHALREP